MKKLWKILSITALSLTLMAPVSTSQAKILDINGDEEPYVEVINLDKNYIKNHLKEGKIKVNINELPNQAEILTKEDFIIPYYPNENVEKQMNNDEKAGNIVELDSISISKQYVDEEGKLLTKGKAKKMKLSKLSLKPGTKLASCSNGTCNDSRSSGIENNVSRIYTYSQNDTSNSSRKRNFLWADVDFKRVGTFVSSGTSDSKDDYIGLGWNVAPITYSDSSRKVLVTYSKIDGTSSINKTESNFTRDSNDSGNLNAWRIPDRIYSNNYYYYPDYIQISNYTGYYSKGGYSGSNGTARVEYIHGWSTKDLAVSYSFGYPPTGSVTFQFNPTSQSESTFVYTDIDTRY
jgi:hypothetical protein